MACIGFLLGRKQFFPQTPLLENFGLGFVRNHFGFFRHTNL
jgi:hypothetical protein